MVVGDQRTVPAALPPRRTRYLGGPQGRSGQVRKISPPLTYHVRSPNRPARSEWLYRLLYPSPHLWYSYLLTPWCRFLLEKLTGLQLVKKFPAFYGGRRFITALTSVRHLSLSCASPIQSTYPHPTSWRLWYPYQSVISQETILQYFRLE